MPILIFCLSDMLHYLGIQIEYQFFGDVGAVVAEAFHFADDSGHVKADQGTSRMLFYVISNDPGRVMVDLVDQVVFQEDA